MYVSEYTNLLVSTEKFDIPPEIANLKKNSINVEDVKRSPLKRRINLKVRVAYGEIHTTLFMRFKSRDPVICIFITWSRDYDSNAIDRFYTPKNMNYSWLDLLFYNVF